MLSELMKKTDKLVIGLMSGTSADGIDAVLCRITGYGIHTKVKQLAFVSPSYDKATHDRILRVAKGDFGGTKELCLLNVYLAELFADACELLCKKAGIDPSEVDLIGSHGQTLYHIPVSEEYLGRSIRATYQLGEASVLAERIGAVTVSDFRVRDMAAGGLGAPLVPYTEYILYADPERNVGLQNIGGIGNITILPAGCALEDLTAFDTGPGNMLMDALTSRITNGRKTFDENGELAFSGTPNSRLLEKMMQDPYLYIAPPKTTGREYYGESYVQQILEMGKELSLSEVDILSTTTLFTAACIEHSIRHHCPVKPDRLIIGGGGALNPCLMADIRKLLPDVEVLTNEDLGFDGSAKEAIAFALLANETIHGICNNAPAATGASHPVVMGKITQ
ncbi:MAG: anhydro-N-acetylmuramic acid kinase [Firmicutes bacterium]|nr:anhydro-N-acetylmuramic acid kinase [Bacillota bacterium]